MTERVLIRCRVAVAVLLSGSGVAACSHAPAATAPTPTPAATATAPAIRSDSAYIAQARADSARLPYTQADIDFMTGMISHHAQAIDMSRMAPTHGASPAVRTLADRIINAQTDEIRLMQQWLADRRQPVPPAKAVPMKHTMGGMEHEMWMNGMLTPEQMQALDAARGTEFDRQFLTGMIGHHQGAVAMVEELFGTPGAANDVVTNKLAQDVQVDQKTEIVRMQQMLLKLQFESPSPSP
jgi:uncharacterized protein (DUF305 family)